MNAACQVFLDSASPMTEVDGVKTTRIHLAGAPPEVANYLSLSPHSTQITITCRWRGPITSNPGEGQSNSTLWAGSLPLDVDEAFLYSLFARE